MMRKKELTGWLFLTGMALTVAFYAAVWRVGPAHLIDFFFHRGPTQPLSTLFFSFGLALVASRICQLTTQSRAFRQLVSSVPADSVGREDALKLAARVARVSWQSLSGHLLTELLRGYGRGDELQTLVERLAAQAREASERGDSRLTAVRQVLPMLGLVGAVLGLSWGMVDFAGTSQAAQSLEILRDRLRDFAHSLGTAFDTTLLALGYGLVLWVGDLILQRRDDAFVGNVVQLIRDVANKLQPATALEEDSRQLVQEHLAEFRRVLTEGLARGSDEILAAFRQELHSGLSDAVKGWCEQWGAELTQASRHLLDAATVQNARITAEIGQLARESLAQFTSRLDAIEQALARPRPIRLQIVGDHEDAYERIGH